MPFEPLTKKPTPTFLEKTKKILQEKYDAARQVIDAKSTKWKKWMDMYEHEIQARDRDYEANLIIPKPYSIIETFTPQVLSTVFPSREFLTIHNPALPEDELRKLNKWFAWFLLVKMGMYLKCMELFKASSIYGSAYLKIFLENGMPKLAYLNPEEFYPDPKCREPGNVDALAWCFHKICNKDIGQLERVTVPRLGIDTDTGMTDLRMAPMYFNLDRVWKKWKDNLVTKSKEKDAEMDVAIPSLDMVEYHGELETKFGVYDLDRKAYTPGRYEEYIVTAVLEGDDLDEIIRCEPSSYYYNDPYEMRVKYLKPFVSSVYTITPGKFHGQGAIQPVESLIRERKEHHDLWLDEHKRAVSTILKVRERSGLTAKDLEFRPFNIWYMRDFGDVEELKSPEVNLQAVQYLDTLLDREADRTLAMSSLSQAVPYSKRQTLGEVRTLMSEQIKRYSAFMQTADHLTLRPLARKIMIIMRQMPRILSQQPFEMPEGDIVVPPDFLMDRTHISFAATAVEPEASKYMKADLWPRVLKGIADLVGVTGGKYELVLPEIMQEFDNLMDIKDPARFVRESRPAIPVDALQAVAGDSPAAQQVVGALIQDASAFMQAEQAMMREQRGGG